MNADSSDETPGGVANGLVARLADTGVQVIGAYGRGGLIREVCLAGKPISIAVPHKTLGFTDEGNAVMVGRFDAHALRARHATVLIEEADHLGALLANTEWLRHRAVHREHHADVLGADALNDFHDYVQGRITVIRERESQPRWWTLGFPRRPRTRDLLISADALLLRADELLEP